MLIITSSTRRHWCELWFHANKNMDIILCYIIRYIIIRKVHLTKQFKTIFQSVPTIGLRKITVNISFGRVVKVCVVVAGMYCKYK